MDELLRPTSNELVLMSYTRVPTEVRARGTALPPSPEKSPPGRPP